MATGGESPVPAALRARYLLPTGMVCGQRQWLHHRPGEVGEWAEEACWSRQKLIPQMTSDDLDTWRVIANVFIGANFESGIQLALINDPDAQDCQKL